MIGLNFLPFHAIQKTTWMPFEFLCCDNEENCAYSGEMHLLYFIIYRKRQNNIHLRTHDYSAYMKLTKGTNDISTHLL